ncbi:MAG: hypothetical protein U5R06_02200 [candidate division KSB1 bacterium]|nr:hypothetical protein [candidate division KSB1 bacterium]
MFDLSGGYPVIRNVQRPDVKIERYGELMPVQGETELQDGDKIQLLKQSKSTITLSISRIELPDERPDGKARILFNVNIDGPREMKLPGTVLNRIIFPAVIFLGADLLLGSYANVPAEIILAVLCSVSVLTFMAGLRKLGVSALLLLIVLSLVLI